MSRSRECDPGKIAREAHAIVDQKYPGRITLPDAVGIAESLASGTVRDFVAPLTVNLLHRKAQQSMAPSSPAENL